MQHDKIKQRIIKASYKAIDELEKVLLQKIDLIELDPEKAKNAVQGKIEAQKGITEILKNILDLEIELGLTDVKKNKYDDIKIGPEQ